MLSVFVFCCLQDLLQEVKQLNRKVEELEGEKVQYERKLRGTKVLYSDMWHIILTTP